MTKHRQDGLAFNPNVSGARSLAAPTRRRTRLPRWDAPSVLRMRVSESLAQLACEVIVAEVAEARSVLEVDNS